MKPQIMAYFTQQDLSALLKNKTCKRLLSKAIKQHPLSKTMLVFGDFLR